MSRHDIAGIWVAFFFKMPAISLPTEIESSGGPAIVVVGLSNTISIVSNYFATNSVGMVTYEGQAAGAIAARTYGPLRLKPFCGLDPKGTSGTKCTGSPKNLTVVADIVSCNALLATSRLT